MRYEGNIIRPFSEANSYLLQCTLGCSHNQCTFCGTYKDKPYRIRPISEIKTDIRMASEHYGDVEKSISVRRRRHCHAHRDDIGNIEGPLCHVSLPAPCGHLCGAEKHAGQKRRRA